MTLRTEFEQVGRLPHGDARLLVINASLRCQLALVTSFLASESRKASVSLGFNNPTTKKFREMVGDCYAVLDTFPPVAQSCQHVWILKRTRNRHTVPLSLECEFGCTGCHEQKFTFMVEEPAP